MPDRGRLLAEEARGALAFGATLSRIPHERRDEPTVTPDGWSSVVVTAHVAGWLDACADVLEAMAAGTWDGDAEPEETPERVAEINARQAARAAALTWSDASAAVAAARVRARASWEALPEVTAEAWSWFEESGPNHYAKHIHDLTAWLAGTASDPAVGRLLQEDAEAWVPFARLLESIDPSVRDADGWSTVDVAHHVAAWMDLASDLVEHNGGWDDADDFDVDVFNADALAASHQLSFGHARLELDEARSRLRAALAARPDPSDGAKDAFRSSTTEHYDEHLTMLRRLTGSAGDVA
jgi:hypothetical protein